MSLSSNSSLLQWHAKSTDDPYRRDFIVPTLVSYDFLGDCQAIAFIGCRTGYIPEQLVSCGIVDKEFFLVDLDDNAIKFAKSLNYGKNDVHFVHAEMSADWNGSRLLDLVIIANTLLEVEVSAALIVSLVKKVKEGGRVVVFLPDYLRDVIEQEATEKGSVASDYVNNGSVTLKKIDRFTNEPYPYQIIRKLFLIELFLRAGTTLESIKRNEDGAGEFALVFKR